MTQVTVQYVKAHVPQPEDLVVWQDGTTCFYDELDEFSYMSDDYEIVPHEESPSLVINTAYVPEFATRWETSSPIDWCSSDLK